MSKAKSAVCRSVSTGPQSFLWASTGLGHVWRLKSSKVRQDCRMWVGGWGSVPHGHSSEWEIFSLWRWERSWQCPVLSLKIVTWAALSSWWTLSVESFNSSCPILQWKDANWNGSGTSHDHLNWPRLSYREQFKEEDEEADRENDGKTTSKSGLALDGTSCYGKLRTVRSEGSWL